MKPFKFYNVVEFPGLTLRSPRLVTRVQPNFIGDREDPNTELTLINPAFFEQIERHLVESSFWKNVNGYVRLPQNGKLERIHLSGYMSPIRLDMFRDKDRRIAIFQAPKKACKGVALNLSKPDFGVKLSEIRVDLDDVCRICPKFSAVWFRNLSSYIRSAAVSGSQLENDSVFKNLAKLGEKSSVVINWRYEEIEHGIMITESGSIVLVNDYKNDLKTELSLVLDVYDKVVLESISSMSYSDSGSDLLDPEEFLQHNHAKKSRRKQQQDPENGKLE